MTSPTKDWSCSSAFNPRRRRIRQFSHPVTQLKSVQPPTQCRLWQRREHPGCEPTSTQCWSVNAVFPNGTTCKVTLHPSRFPLLRDTVSPRFARRRRLPGRAKITASSTHRCHPPIFSTSAGERHVLSTSIVQKGSLPERKQTESREHSLESCRKDYKCNRGWEC